MSDSRIEYPVSSDLPSSMLTPEVLQTLYVPSSRYYYGNFIPEISQGDILQVRRDVSAWQNPLFPTVYIKGIKESVSPEVDFIELSEGYQIHFPQNIDMQSYKRRCNEFWTAQNFGVHFAGIIQSFPQWTDFFKYPFHPDANVNSAGHILESAEQIQAYLNQRGVRHFNASNVMTMPWFDRFFMLTHFYGQPKQGDLTAEIIVQKYRGQSRNNITLDLANKLKTNIASYRMHQQNFDAFFDALNQNPDLDLTQHFSSNNQTRIFHDFFNYLDLLSLPTNVPVLTLNTLRQLHNPTPAVLYNLLSNYTDNRILELVGNYPSLLNAQTRGEFLISAGRLILDTQVFLMHPMEARACNNSETVAEETFRSLNRAFLGKGSLATGFDCYDVEELIQSFQANTTDDGYITFRDPLHYQNNFTVEDLQNFRKALGTTRAGLVVDPKYLEAFDRYVTQAQLQASRSYRQILELRAFPNKEIIRNLLLHYFYTGMYFRQWAGPGHPYPIVRGETGREERVGSATEITIATNVTQEKEQVLHYLSQLPPNLQRLFWDLPSVEFRNGQVVEIGRTIGYWWHKVIEQGTYCIRMASGPWTFTGGYYLKQILNENIPGFDLTQGLDFIS